MLLAELLERRGLWSIPESIRRGVSGNHRRLRDVTLADLSGLRIIIEGKILDGEGQRGRLLECRGRVEEGLCLICLAVLCPPALRNVRTLTAARHALDSATLEVCVISEGDDGMWGEADIDSVVALVHRG